LPKLRRLTPASPRIPSSRRTAPSVTAARPRAAHFGGPALISEKTKASSIDDLRSSIITNGKGRMPKYAGKLTPEEIDTLAQEIEALNKK
jgi:mono/diheme cytochrome c family protein